MIIDAWVTVVPGGDRPYFSSWPPSPERKKLINDKGGKVFKLEVAIPGFEATEDGYIALVAIPNTERV